MEAPLAVHLDVCVCVCVVYPTGDSGAVLIVAVFRALGHTNEIFPGDIPAST